MVITLPYSVLHAYSCPVHIHCVTWPPSSTPEPWHCSATLQPNPSMFFSLGWSSPNLIITLNSSQRHTLKMLTSWGPLYKGPHLMQRKVQCMSIHWAEIVHDVPLPPATWLHSLNCSTQDLSSLLSQICTLRSSQLCIPTCWLSLHSCTPGSGLNTLPGLQSINELGGRRH